MRNKNLIFGVVFVLLVFVSLVIFQGASAQTKPPATGFENICGQGVGLAKCVQQIYILALGLGSIVALLMIVLAGYRYMTAAGNAQQVENAKEAFASAFIGLIVIFVAFILLYLINPDLVRFKGFSLPVPKISDTQQPASANPQVKSAMLAQDLTQGASLAGADIRVDGSIALPPTAEGKQLILTPDLSSSLSTTFDQTLALYGLDPSKLSIVEYQVSDPNLLPPEMIQMLDGQKPSRILVVTGSLFVFNATAMHADTSGGLLLDAVKLVALEHYGVNVDVNAELGANGSCGTTCRLCDNNPTQCSAAPGCEVVTTSLGATACLAKSSTGTTQPPSGSCPSGTIWTGHMDANGQPICTSDGTLQAGQTSCALNEYFVNGRCECESPLTRINGACINQSIVSSFTPCTLRVFCEDPNNPGQAINGSDSYRNPSGTCEGTGGGMREECYYDSQSKASIDCDRTYRNERESCMEDIANQGPGPSSGTVNNQGLPSCDSASAGSACTSDDGAVHCAYSNQEEAFYCGQAWSGTTGGYCLPEGSLPGCFPAPDCKNAQTLGEQAACS